jgi:alkylation response protein AidB-like acyl-CoA dehydrogenase
MALAISADHVELAEAVAAFLEGVNARAANRECLQTTDQTNAHHPPTFWSQFAELGFLGLHLPAAHGGSGVGLPEAAIVAEQLGRALAPGAFTLTMAAAAVIAELGDSDLQARTLPELAAGTTSAAVGLSGALSYDRGAVCGDAGAVLGGADAALLLLAVGEDIALIATNSAGVSLEIPASLDPSRPSAIVALDAVAPMAVLTGARRYATAVFRTLIAAEATGAAAMCVTEATAYAKVREQFGRVIGTFGPVKHHLANMLVAAELATAATWDSARAAQAPLEEFELAAACAQVLAINGFVSNAELNVQVHGGIGYTWEHDAHLFQRRAYTLRALLPPGPAATEVAALRAADVDRRAAVALPDDVEAQRPTLREMATALAALPAAEQRERLIETRYLQPHWPAPWGVEAPAGLQLLIDQEFAAAGVRRPNLSITGWVILTLAVHGTPAQVQRWVRPALAGLVGVSSSVSRPPVRMPPRYAPQVCVPKVAGSSTVRRCGRATRIVPHGGWRRSEPTLQPRSTPA